MRNTTWNGPFITLALGRRALFRDKLTIRMSTRHLSDVTEMNKSKISIYWYRNALRFHDNPSLLDACVKSESLLPLYIIDPVAPFRQTVGAGCLRANFILESIRYVDEKLRGINPNSQMVVILGTPETVLPKVVATLGATNLFYEREPAAPIRELDRRVLQGISSIQQNTTSKCQIHGYDTHTIHPMETYLAKCTAGTAPATYGGFTKIFQSLSIPMEVEDVEAIPSLPRDALDRLRAVFGDAMKMPTLDELGYDPTDLEQRAKGGLAFTGGEDIALQLLERQVMNRQQWVATFEKPKTSPNALTVDTTGLSPYVKHGCLSPRRFYNALSKVYSKFNEKNISKPPVSLHGQLMWREYNYLMGYGTPNFDKMVDNPIARQIPWDDDPELVTAWKEARTGYPYIDAVMTQLRMTGWIHHLARHSVACFLTRGDLWQSWEHGAAIFEEFLIDADWSINNFNWQWLSCTAHFYQYFRCYSPISFGKKTDPNGDYIRKWVPIFRTMPAKYIFEPWEAPLSVQQQCGVIVGETYPHPIVDHKVISKSNMGRMKDAYDAHKEVHDNENRAARPLPSEGPHHRSGNGARVPKRSKQS